MKKTRSLWVGILTLFCMSSVLFPCAKGEEITATIVYVGGNGPGNYSSIQAAVNNATANVTIFVYNGTYYENLVIEKSLILLGESNNGTIINGGGNKFVVTLAADQVTLSGFMITHSEMEFPFSGIYVVSGYNTISNNVLTDNFYGIQLGYGAGYNVISNNVIFDNERCGVYFNHSSHNRLVGNIVRNHPANGFGLYEFSNNNSILDNTLSGNQYTGVNIRESYDNQVIGNTFIQDQVGLHKPSPEYHTVTRDNIFSGNIVSFEEERDAIAFTVVFFDIFVVLAYLIFRKRFA
jgi:parallel beta-helix repeat protein